MPHPSIFTYLPEHLEHEILSLSETAEAFRFIKSSAQDCWMKQLAKSGCNIAIIYISQFKQDELDTFNSLSFNKTTMFILLDDGEPNEYLDRLKLTYHCYHFRPPIDYDMLREAILELSTSFSLYSKKHKVSARLGINQFGLLLGSSNVMKTMYRTIRKVAATESSVLIDGESGTGKELVANTIHLASGRTGPMVSINCAALSSELVESELFGHAKGAFTGAVKYHEGVFEQAREGTLFLDEIGEMPLATQAKLLRVLESGEFRPVGSSTSKSADVRIITATNRCLLSAIKEKLFREDLYFRLAHFPISVPPLRQREDDILDLAKYFLAYRNAKNATNKILSVAAQTVLQNYEWPGNVRQLRHAIERAFILSDIVIKPEHFKLEQPKFDDEESNSVPELMTLGHIERLAIEQSMRYHNGNKLEVAKQLGISVKTLYNKLEKYQSTNELTDDNRFAGKA